CRTAPGPAARAALLAGDWAQAASSIAMPSQTPTAAPRRRILSILPRDEAMIHEIERWTPCPAELVGSPGRNVHRRDAEKEDGREGSCPTRPLCASASLRFTIDFRRRTPCPAVETWLPGC